MKLLEEQALVPMFGEHPIELGLREGDGFLSTLRSDPEYRRLFAAAFPAEQDPFTIKDVTRALACFERSIVSARSPYDRYHYGGADSAVSESAKRGEILFFSQQIACFRCHGGFNFSDATASENRTVFLSAAEPRNLRIHEIARGYREIQGRYAEKYRGHGALHARRKHRDARRRSRSLCRRRQKHRFRSECRSRTRQPQQGLSHRGLPTIR